MIPGIMPIIGSQSLSFNSANVPDHLMVFGPFCCGWYTFGTGGVGGGTIGAANMAIYYPFWTPIEYKFDRFLTYNGPTVSGNLDCGIYNIDYSKRVSLGSTAQAGAADEPKTYSISEHTLPPGGYYFGFAVDNNTGTYYRSGWATNPSLEGMFLNGIGAQASAFPLPATMAPQHSGFTVSPVVVHFGIVRTGALA